jgi:hypothetical protein
MLIMNTVYDLLYNGGLYLDIRYRNSYQFVYDLESHVADITDKLYPNKNYQRNTIGYYQDIPVLCRNYSNIEIQRYIWKEIWKFVKSKDIIAFDGRCNYIK